MNVRSLPAIALLVCVVAGGACSDRRAEPTAVAAAIATLTPMRTATPTRTATPAITQTSEPTPSLSDALPCEAGQLNAVAKIGESALAGGGLFGYITISNDSPTPCMVGGRPVVSLVDGDGNPLPIAPDTHAQPTPVIEVLLNREASTRIYFTWLNWCPPGAKERSSNPLPSGGVRLLIMVRGGQVVASDERGAPLRTGGPRCMDPTASMSLSVGAFGAG
jgi:hypothetical protein